MSSDASDPEPSVQAPPLGENRVGAPGQEHDAAFAKFYIMFMPLLVRFLRWHGAMFPDAADIAQETMAQLYQYWPDVRDAKAWTRRVAARRLGRLIADASREHPVDDTGLNQEHTCQLLTADEILAIEQHHDVVRLLDTLPSRQRQVLAWTLEGYTPSEIAEELRLTPEAVRANLYKARRAAARHLREEGR